MDYCVWNQYHSEDIYSMHAHGNKILVTASYSGDIIFRKIDFGRAGSTSSPAQTGTTSHTHMHHSRELTIYGVKGSDSDPLEGVFHFTLRLLFILLYLPFSNPPPLPPLALSLPSLTLSYS